MSISMDDQLMEFARFGNIESLYSILANDPFILERIDSKPVAHTPLHVAAISGNTHFAMELATVKPSLARKLNHFGLSPIHLALVNGNDQLVRSLVAVDPELLRVKSIGRFTPVHYVAAAEMENVDLLAEFLSACPSSVEDLTVRCETVVYVAVKNKSFDALKVLLGWLRRVNKEEILNWKDEDGNTVLHIATSTNQPEVMKLLIKYVNKNAKNLSGLTAMDMFHHQRDSLDKEVGKILRRAKAKRASELANGSTSTLANYLRRDLSLVEKRDKFFTTVSKTTKKSESDLRNVVLVVAILIATATYQAVLSPPGGFWQDTYNPPPNNSNTTNINGYNTTITGGTANDQGQTMQPHKAGQMILGQPSLFHFFSLNTIALYVSVFTILIVMVGLPYCTILSLSTAFLLYAYYAALSATFPSQQGFVTRILGVLFTTIVYVCAVITAIVPSIASARYAKLKCRVDNPKRQLGELI